MNHPYLTVDQPGIGGRLKVEPADFFVEELPLYEPCGQGQHVYATIEKTKLSTYAAVRRIAQALNISPNAVGTAGLKDAHAVTRQTVSLEQVSPDAVAALDLPNITILKVTRHQNKLKSGHLAGNRFVIRVRDVQKQAVSVVENVLDILGQRGVPNFFDAQRFGNRRNTDRLGELLVRGNQVEFVAEFLGRPQAHEFPDIRSARQLVDQHQWAEALAIWPHNLSDERRVLGAISKAGGNVEVSFKALNKKLKTFFISAFQAKLFNELLVERLEQIDQLQQGDIAYIHHKGASFLVEDQAMEQPRVDTFEISPSGPIFGTKTLMAEGEPGQQERAVLADHTLTLDSFKIQGLKIRGTRRPYRFPLSDTNTWWDDGLMIAFTLPSGAYATRVLAEIMKV